MPLNGPTAYSASATDLGLGDMLSGQVKDQNEEERKKRLAMAREREMLGPAAMTLGLGGGIGR